MSRRGRGLAPVWIAGACRRLHRLAAFEFTAPAPFSSAARSPSGLPLRRMFYVAEHLRDAVREAPAAHDEGGRSRCEDSEHDPDEDRR
jgi:hypothetical protein